MWWTDAQTLSARRDVATGEELTCDYSTCVADPDFLLRCHCGSYRCRQMVTGDDWRIPQLQAAYAGHWLPPLRDAMSARAKSPPAATRPAPKARGGSQDAPPGGAPERHDPAD